MGVSKKQGYTSLRTPFVGFSSKKERSIKLALSFSGTVDLGLVSQIKNYTEKQGASIRMPGTRAGVGVGDGSPNRWPRPTK